MDIIDAMKEKKLFVCPVCGGFDWIPVGTGFCSRQECTKCGVSN